MTDETERPETAEQGQDQATTDAGVGAGVAGVEGTDAASGTARSGRHRARSITSAVLVVVAVLGLVASTVGLWARNTALDTDRWVEAVGPLIDDPAVVDLLATELTTQLVTALDLEQRVAGVLPSELTIVAGPLTAAAETQIREAVEAVLNSDRMAELWVDINRAAHERVVAVLTGESTSVALTEDGVVLNLLPIINEVLGSLASGAGNLFGRDISLPPINALELPADVRDRLSERLGVELPADFGEVVVYSDGTDLSRIPELIRTINRVLVLVVVLTLVCMVAAVAVAPDRRRGLVILSVASAGAIVGLRLVLRPLVADQIDAIADPQVAAAVSSALVLVTARLTAVVDVELTLALLVAAIAYLAGPGRLPRLLRSGAGTAAGAAGDLARRNETRAFVRRNLDALRVGAAVLVVVMLLALDSPGWGALVVLAALLAAFEVGVTVLARPTPDEASVPAAPPVSTPAAPPVSPPAAPPVSPP